MSDTRCENVINGFSVDIEEPKKVLNYKDFYLVKKSSYTTYFCKLLDLKIGKEATFIGVDKDFNHAHTCMEFTVNYDDISDETIICLTDQQARKYLNAAICKISQQISENENNKNALYHLSEFLNGLQRQYNNPNACSKY